MENNKLMTNLVNTWQQRGHLYLWRYPDDYRNYPGWHCSADRAGVASLLELIAALECSRAGLYRTLQVSPPTPDMLRVPNNNSGTALAWAPARLRLSVDLDPAASSKWELSVNQDTATLALGERYLALLKTGVMDIAQGRGDYCIGGHENETARERTCLWFWWQVS